MHKAFDILIFLLLTALGITYVYAEQIDSVISISRDHTLTINLSNLGEGEWVIVNQTEIEDIVNVSSTFFPIDDTDERSETLYVFSFIGTASGFGCVDIYYILTEEVVICVEIEFIVDAENNITLQEITMLPGIYQDHFSG